jgi:phage shock protein C
MEKKLYRDEQRKVIGGVCAGLSDYLSIDVSIVRLVFLLALIFKGGGGIIYFIMWAVVPRKEKAFGQPFVDYTVPPVTPDDYQQQTYQHAKPYPPFYPPVTPVKKGSSTARLIFGLVLILLGVIFILDQFEIIPDWDFEKLWPVILIAIGGVLIFSRSKKQPWEKDDWHKADEPATTVDTTTDNSSTTNPPTL